MSDDIAGARYIEAAEYGCGDIDADIVGTRQVKARSVADNDQVAFLYDFYKLLKVFIGFYFFLAILYTFSNNNYFTAPFLILFVIGYWYTGLMSLLQGRFERWRQGGGANTDEESSPKPFPVGV